MNADDLKSYFNQFPKMNLPKVQPEPPDFEKIFKDSVNTNLYSPPNYEDTFYKKMADDIKGGYSEEIEKTNKYLKEQLALAVSQIEDAKKEARISKIISVISIVLAIAGIIIPILL